MWHDIVRTVASHENIMCHTAGLCTVAMSQLSPAGLWAGYRSTYSRPTHGTSNLTTIQPFSQHKIVVLTWNNYHLVIDMFSLSVLCCTWSLWRPVHTGAFSYDFAFPSKTAGLCTVDLLVHQPDRPPYPTRVVLRRKDGTHNKEKIILLHKMSFAQNVCCCLFTAWDGEKYWIGWWWF